MKGIQNLQMMLANLGFNVESIVKSFNHQMNTTMVVGNFTFMLRDGSDIIIEEFDSEHTSKLLMVRNIVKDKNKFKHILIDEKLSEASIAKIPMQIAAILIKY